MPQITFYQPFNNCFYVSGIIIMTFGIALTIRSLMGTSPFDALLVGLFQTFGLTIGRWEIVVSRRVLEPTRNDKK